MRALILQQLHDLTDEQAVAWVIDRLSGSTFSHFETPPVCPFAESFDVDTQRMSSGVTPYSSWRIPRIQVRPDEEYPTVARSVKILSRLRNSLKTRTSRSPAA
jgi:hypothetical protein